jgi:hypothetical protein
MLPANADESIKSGSSITLTGHVMNIPNAKIVWRKDGGSWSSVHSPTYTVTKTGTYEGKVDGTDFVDSITIGKTIDGAAAIAITLSNPTMTFNTTTSNETETCKVIVYEGGNLLPYGTGNSQFQVSKASS